MNSATTLEIVTAFLVFCRVGSCVMILPGLGGGRVPPTVRLFLAFALSLALMPVVDRADFAGANAQTTMLAVYVVLEVIVGLFLGFLVRIFYLALEFIAVAMANFAGFGSIFMQAVDDNSSTTPFSELITLPALALFFILDLHVAVIGMLKSSYDVVTVGQWAGSTIEPNILVNAFQSSFALALQMSAPLLVYSLALNLVLGLLSKLTPQVPIYFVSIPFLIAGGLFMLFQTDGIILSSFTSSVSTWITGLATDG